MKLTRRGLFKTLAGALVATKAAPMLPAMPMAHVSEIGTYELRFDAIDAVTLAEINRHAIPDAFFSTTSLFPSPLIYKLREDRPWLNNA